MSVVEEVTHDSIFMGKLEYGDDLLTTITAICVERGIKLGRISAIGAVQKARVGYYDQKSQTYQFRDLNYPMEILNLVGNISIKDGDPFVHVHITLIDEHGEAHGGHLASGTVVFACELVIEGLSGPQFVRSLDGETGLPLWGDGCD